jgi:RNA recognition motif-containing protein
MNIGNISPEVTEKDIKQHFRNRKIRIYLDRKSGKNRGVAYVNLEVKADEEAAIQALDGSEYMEKRLKLSKAKPQKDRGPRIERD